MFTTRKKSRALSCFVLGCMIIGIFCFPAIASSSVKPIIEYAPPQGTIINGVEQPINEISPNIIGYDKPIFVSYAANQNSVITYFKLIGSSTWDNTRSPSPMPVTFNITQSSSSGSEYTGNVTLNADIQAGLVGRIGGQVSGGAKWTRSTNEAVGWTFGPWSIPAYKHGKIEAYWEGTASYGTLGVKYVDTGSASGYTPVSYSQINCKVHKNAKVINGKTSVW